jgi:transcriptional regulator with XRE-family HTH domain
MKTRSFNYLRAYRQRWSITARELAKLSHCDPSVIARLEKGPRPPTGRIALAFEVIFGVPIRGLFPSAYENVEELVMARAVRLHELLTDKADKRSARKRELLEEMMKRATEHGLHV